MISPNYTNTDFNICLCAIYLHEIFAPNDDKNLCRLLVAGCLKNLPWIEQFMTRFVIIITNVVIIVITIIVITIIAITIMAITILIPIFNTCSLGLQLCPKWLLTWADQHTGLSHSHTHPSSFSHSHCYLCLHPQLSSSIFVPKYYHWYFFRPFPIWSMRAKYGYRPTSGWRTFCNSDKYFGNWEKYIYLEQ